MQSGLRGRLRRLLARVRRVERRELRSLRRWLERTQNVVHLSILLFVPSLLGLVTYLSNSVSGLSFLLYPPLAAGAFTLFSDPEGRYASLRRFVGGLTAGAICGWVAVVVGTTLFYETGPGEIHAIGAALSVFFTGLVTWLLDIEEPAAFSTALLTLFVQARIDRPELYVLSIAASSALVAGGFAVWRRSFYERRDQYLYESVRGDDHVLVPTREGDAAATAMLGARLAAAHRAGKVVLLDLVDEEWLAEAERALLADHGAATLRDDRLSTPPVDVSQARGSEAVSEAVARLEERAQNIETRVGVPCEVAVAVSGQLPAQTVLRVADRVNCDLVVAPYEEESGQVTQYVRGLFDGTRDVLVHRARENRNRWKRILVPVRGASDVAHSMIDFATRLAAQTGSVSVANCIGSERERRRAEAMLADLVEPFEGAVETRVAREPIEEFLARNAREYDLVVVGASRDRTRVSRLVSPPTFERIGDIDADVAIVDRN
jgi:nucleotide-binding universal stress UspA family protein